MCVSYIVDSDSELFMNQFIILEVVFICQVISNFKLLKISTIFCVLYMQEKLLGECISFVVPV
jgi:hypothetical protein